MLVLRGEHGFVCYHRGSNLLDSNRSVYDVFHVGFSDGAYQIRGGWRVLGGGHGVGRGLLMAWMDPGDGPRGLSAGQGGKFWYVASSGAVCSDGDLSEDFFFEFRERGRVAIKGKNGRYLRGDPAGTLRADSESVLRATLWEY